MRSLLSGLPRSLISGVGLWLSLSQAALATAFFINQQSVRGLARVDAGNTAAADELGTIFFNPAGLIQIWKDDGDGDYRASFGAHLIIPTSHISDRGSAAATPGTLGMLVPYDGGDTKNPTDPTPVPNIYIARRLADGRAAVGFAINVPFGLDTKSSSDWFGRYDAIEAALRTINLSVVGAYKVNEQVFIGGGVDLEYAHTKLVTAIPNPFVPGGPTPATDAHAETSGHAWTPGFNVGVLFTPQDDTRIGLHYRSGMTHKIKGSTTTTGLTGPLEAFNGTVGARADLKLPAIGTVGVWHRVDPQLVLLGEFEWYDWSTFKEVRTRFDNGAPDVVRPTNYRDAYGIAVGAEYRLSDYPIVARGGIHYDTTPTTDAFRDTTVPDSERLWLGIGATYEHSRNFNIDFAFNQVFFRNTSINITRTFFDGTPLASAVNINGSVKANVNTVSIDLRWRF